MSDQYRTPLKDLKRCACGGRPKIEKWVDTIVNQARKRRVPVFMKDSLLPVVGEENLLWEFPWGKWCAE